MQVILARAGGDVPGDQPVQGDKLEQRRRPGGEGESEIAMLPQFVLRPITLIAVMAAAHAAGYRLDAGVAMIAFAFATWSTALFQLVTLHRLVARHVAPGPRQYHLHEWLSVSLPVIAVWAFFQLLAYTDVIVLRHFRPAEDVGAVFRSGQDPGAGRLHLFLGRGRSRAPLHRLSHRRRPCWAGTFRAQHHPVDVLAIARCHRSDPGARQADPVALGSDYVAGYPLMFILAVGLMARATVGPAERLLNMLGEQRLCALVYACAFGVNLIVALALAPRLGGIGAAIATSAAIVVESVLLAVVAKWRLGLHLFIWRPRTLHRD